MGFDYAGPGFGDAVAPGAVGASVVGVFAVFYGLAMLLSLAFSVAVYILHSFGLYTIGNRRGIRHSWLAWVPVGNLWLLGSISDQYQYVVKGKVKNRRRVLLGLSIATAANYIVWFVALIASLIASETVGGAAVGVVLLTLVSTLALIALTITLMVYEYICYYDLYCSCERNNGVLYLILSIVFSAVLPFLVFACRKKDDGMPPRKQPPVQPVVEPVVEPTVEPIVEGFAQPEEFEEE